MITTPAQGNALPPNVLWCADNGCFGKGYPGEAGYLAWLAARQQYADLCWFATAPDVLLDARATLERSRPVLPRIRALGYPAALVAQNGLEDLAVPWEEFDVLFIGADTEWKLSDAARGLSAEAIARGKPVHMGRVNSLKRLRIASSFGCSSVDGTYMAFGPDINLARMLRWLDQLATEESNA